MQTLKPVSTFAASLIALGMLAATASAAGKDFAFAGTWAANPAHCKNAQDVMDAPMLLTSKGYDQHEAHCTFSNVKAGKADWTAKATCSVEGDSQTMDIRLKLRGRQLLFWTGRGRPWVLNQCL